jgi:CheY-like chemotaxis protein
MREVKVRTVLVVDDDEVSRELLTMFVAEAGFKGVAADSGDEALELLEEMAVAPYAVLADMQMQGTTGNALAERLRERCGAETRLIAMSGSRVAAEKTRAFDGFLLKPLTIGELRASLEGGQRVEEAADEAGALNEATYASLAQGMPREQLMKLYGMCLDDAERRIGQMREAVGAGDAAAYERSAHAIKGGCGMVGAAELARLAGEMEQHGPQIGGELEPLEQFLAACARLRRILDARVV